MSNSSLVSYTKISPNKNSPRNHKIDTISIHCVVGQLTVETLGNVFAPVSRQASCNYGIGYDGRIGMYCEEKDRSWCTSSSSNDNRAITIEVASDKTTPYKVTGAAYNSLISLLADICRRNGIKKLLWRADKSLIGQVDKQNMTVHRWFASKSCPGDYLYNLHGQIAAEVNERLGGETPVINIQENASSDIYDSVNIGDIVEFKGAKQYAGAQATNASSARPGKVKITQKYTKNSKHPIHARSIDDAGKFIAGVYGWIDLDDITPTSLKPYLIQTTVDALNYRTGPGTNYKVVGTIRDKNSYTIVQEKDGWGQLKSKVGWISLKYTKRV